MPREQRYTSEGEYEGRLSVLQHPLRTKSIVSPDKWSNKGAHSFSKYITFPFKTELRCSIGRTFNISPYHWLTAWGLGLIHWKRTHLLASRRSLYKSFRLGLDRESSSSERPNRNKPGFICMLLPRIELISCETFPQNLNIKGQHQIECI